MNQQVLSFLRSAAITWAFGVTGGVLLYGSGSRQQVLGAAILALLCYGIPRVLAHHWRIYQRGRRASA